MRVLIACEESQAVTKEFRALGHEAYSCDIEPCSGGYPEWHLQQDVLPLLKEKWDMIIAFPPCTHLAVSGAAWFETKRKDGRQQQGIDFFMEFIKADCSRIAVENPVGIISGDYIAKWFPELQEKYNFPIKPSQKIQPWQYGDPYEKTTCLWLKNLPLLSPTNIVQPEERFFHKSGKSKPKWFADAFKLPPKERAKVRSKTFLGIAKAMAEQWGGLA